MTYELYWYRTLVSIPFPGNRHFYQRGRRLGDSITGVNPLPGEPAFLLRRGVLFVLVGFKVSIPFPGNRHFYGHDGGQRLCKHRKGVNPLPGEPAFLQTEAVEVQFYKSSVSIPFPGNRHFYRGTLK